MSFNHNPEWTPLIKYPNQNKMKCPYCGKVASNVNEVMDNLYNVTYYSARHIPPRLIFTCDNIKCEHCDEDYDFILSVVIKAKG